MRYEKLLDNRLYYKVLEEYEYIKSLEHGHGCLTPTQKEFKESKEHWLFPDGIKDTTLKFYVRRHAMNNKIFAIIKSCKILGLDWEKVIYTENNHFFYLGEDQSFVTIKLNVDSAGGYVDFHFIYSTGATMDVCVGATSGNILTSKVSFKEVK